jgi:hypothetical protein
VPFAPVVREAVALVGGRLDDVVEKRSTYGERSTICRSVEDGQRPYLVSSTSRPVDNSVEKWIRTVGYVDGSGLGWRKLAKARCTKTVLSRTAYAQDRTNEDIP